MQAADMIKIYLYCLTTYDLNVCKISVKVLRDLEKCNLFTQPTFEK